MMYIPGLLSQLLLAAGLAGAKWIVPGARWRDTDGNLVNAHAGCVTVHEESGKFFLFGEYKVEGKVEGGGVSVYSSDDLATWESHGFALSTLCSHTVCNAELNGTEPIEGHPYLDPKMIIQRPKVVYSNATEKYHVSINPVYQ